MKQTRLGIVGGMGPLASAAFVRSIYGMYRGRVEQETPVVLLHSNPAISDRTATFLGGGDHTPLLRDLESAIHFLLEQDMQHVVICCVTMHYLLPLVSDSLRTRVISLIDAAFDEIENDRGRCLLICSTGTMRLGLFQQNPRWSGVHERIVLPTEEEQDHVHHAIYTLKREHTCEPLIQALHEVAGRHRADSIIAGCTELHLLSRASSGENSLNSQYTIIDPLTAIVQRCIQEEYALSVCA